MGSGTPRIARPVRGPLNSRRCATTAPGGLPFGEATTSTIEPRRAASRRERGTLPPGRRAATLRGYAAAWTPVSPPWPRGRDPPEGAALPGDVFRTDRRRRRRRAIDAPVRRVAHSHRLQHSSVACVGPSPAPTGARWPVPRPKWHPTTTTRGGAPGAPAMRPLGLGADAFVTDDHDDRLARARRYVLGVERMFGEQLALIEHLAGQGHDTAEAEEQLRGMQRHLGAMDLDRLRGRGREIEGGPAPAGATP